MVGAIAPRWLPALKHRRNHGADASEARIMEGYEITAKQGNHTKAPAGTMGASQFMSRAPSSETAALAAILLTPCFSGVLMADLTS
jgi:hypothetical protein